MRAGSGRRNSESTETGTGVVFYPITVSDSDNLDPSWATVSIASGYVPGEDALNFVNQGTIGGSYNTSTGTVTLTGRGIFAEYQAALRTVTYSDSSSNPSTGNRSRPGTKNWSWLAGVGIG